MPKQYNLTEGRFGKLTVTGLRGKDKSGNLTWDCICDCGRKIITTSHMLVSGIVVDCGCDKTQKGRKKYNKKSNEYVIINGIAYVKMMTSDEVMLCDADDWEQWKQYHWNVNNKDGYVRAFVDGKTVVYHHHLLDTKDGYVRDHINRNRLDNRKCNLRYATSHANSLNKSISKINTSGYCGVSYEKRIGKWRAYIFFNNKMIHIGYYDKQEDAIKARKEAETKYHKPILEKETLQMG